MSNATDESARKSYNPEQAAQEAPRRVTPEQLDDLLSEGARRLMEAIGDFGQLAPCDDLTCDVCNPRPADPQDAAPTADTPYWGPDQTYAAVNAAIAFGNATLDYYKLRLQQEDRMQDLAITKAQCDVQIKAARTKLAYRFAPAFALVGLVLGLVIR